MVGGIYGFARGCISKRVVRELRKRKLGGAGQEVIMDCYKLGLKTKSNVEEFWIIGFIEKESERARAYLSNDVKIDTIALFIAKTVAKHTTLLTPYYHTVGWEWMDKFYDYQRLKRDRMKKKRGPGKGSSKMSGFEYMWNQIKELELVFLKMGEKTRRLRKIKLTLQGYLDEMVWRIENRKIE